MDLGFALACGPTGSATGTAASIAGLNEPCKMRWLNARVCRRENKHHPILTTIAAVLTL